MIKPVRNIFTHEAARKVNCPMAQANPSTGIPCAGSRCAAWVWTSFTASSPTETMYVRANGDWYNSAIQKQLMSGKPDEHALPGEQNEWDVKYARAAIDFLLKKKGNHIRSLEEFGWMDEEYGVDEEESAPYVRMTRQTPPEKRLGYCGMVNL